MNLEWKGNFAFLDIFIDSAQPPSLDGRGKAKGKPGLCGPTGQTMCGGTGCCWSCLTMAHWPEFKYGVLPFRGGTQVSPGSPSQGRGSRV